MDHQTAVDTLAAERYLLGEMHGDERDAFESHFFDCPDCADDVRTGAVMKDGVRAGLVTPRAVAAGSTNRTTRLWRASVIVPWAAAATFAIVAGYESVQTGPKSAAAPLALAPVTVRPASRGEDAVVAPGPGGALTLAVALAGVDDSSVQYDLRRGDQRLASGEARHAAGAPLLLMIPPGLLQSGDRCVLTVKSAGTADLTVEEYRFRVESR